MCDRRITARVKGNFYKTAMTSKRQKAELEVAEKKMMRFSLGVTKMERLKNQQIRGTVKVWQVINKPRTARLKCLNMKRGEKVDVLDRGCWRQSSKIHGCSEKQEDDWSNSRGGR